MSHGNGKNKKQSKKDGSKRRRVPRTPRLEPLESRWLRAGNVLASVVHGSLIITEDPLTAGTDNQIQVDQIGVPPGTFNVTGGGTTTINGAAAVALPGVVKDVVIQLDGGNDLVTVTTSLIGGNLSIDMGDGENTVLITGTTVRRSVTVSGEAGGDDVGILDSTIGGNVLLLSGDGSNNTDIGGDFDFSASTTAINPVRIRGSLRIEGGEDSDDVSIQSTVVSKSTLLHLKDGDNDVTISGLTRITGPLEITGGIDEDRVKIGQGFADPSRTRVLGMATLNLGAGANEVYIERATLSRGLTVVTKDGPGTDEVNIYNSFIDGEVVLSMGGGANEVFIGSGEIGFTTTIHGALTINGNDGNDTITITNVEILRGALISLGAGSNKTFLSNDHLGGSFLYGGADGSDDVSIFDTTILGQAKFTLGSGDNDVSINSSLILQNFSITGGADADEIFLESLTVGGKAALQTLGGGDVIQINDSIFQNRFTLKSGDGDDTVLIENIAGTATATTFVGQAQLLLGKGDDFLQLGVAADATRLVRFENLTKADVLDGGDDFDDKDENNVTFAITPKRKNFEA